jgi:hypothetical protein
MALSIRQRMSELSHIARFVKKEGGYVRQRRSGGGGVKGIPILANSASYYDMCCPGGWGCGIKDGKKHRWAAIATGTVSVNGACAVKSGYSQGYTEQDAKERAIAKCRAQASVHPIHDCLIATAFNSGCGYVNIMSRKMRMGL